MKKFLDLFTYQYLLTRFKNISWIVVYSYIVTILLVIVSINLLLIIDYLDDPNYVYINVSDCYLKDLEFDSSINNSNNNNLLNKFIDLFKSNNKEFYPLHNKFSINFESSSKFFEKEVEFKKNSQILSMIEFKRTIIQEYDNKHKEFLSDLINCLNQINVNMKK